MSGTPRCRGTRHAISFMTLALAVAFAGCSSTTSPEDSENQTNAVLSLEQIQSATAITAEQASALAPALDRWAGGQAIEHPEAPAALAFLAEASSVVGRDPMFSLIDAVEDHELRRGDREGRRPGRWGRMGHRGFRGLGPLSDLDLTEEQSTALDEARTNLAEAQSSLREALANDSITGKEFEAGIADAKATFAAAVSSILTPEQLATLDAAQRSRLIQQLERRITGLAEGIARRVAHLTEILALDQAQADAVTAILTEMASELEVILAGLVDESLSVADARTLLEALRTATREAVAEVLTEEQAELYAELMTVCHRRDMGDRF